MAHLTRSILLAGLSAIALAAPAAAQQTPGRQRRRRQPVAAPIPTDDDHRHRHPPHRPHRRRQPGADRRHRRRGDLTNTGQTETNKILNQLVPSFNFPQPSIADGTDVLRPATLRGLSPDQTLVLVNGKRRHVSALLNINGTVGRGSAAVDLNLIPALAIEPDRSAARRRLVAIWLGRDRRRDQHPAQERQPRRPRASPPTANISRRSTTSPTSPACRPMPPASRSSIPTDNRYFLANTDGERKARDGDADHARRQYRASARPRGFVNLTAEYRDRNATNRAGFDLRPNYNRPTRRPSTRAS